LLLLNLLALPLSPLFSGSRSLSDLATVFI